jgi:membrane-associated phospholipid phosphatase
VTASPTVNLLKHTSSGEWLLPAGAAGEHSLRYALQVVFGSLGLYVTALWSSNQQVSGFERRAFVVMNGLPDALSPLLFPVMQAGSLLAVFITGGFALLARRPRLAGLIVLAGGSAWILAKFVKRVVERGRPEGLVPDVIIRGVAQMGGGFPSGHVAVAAAMATVAGPYLPARARVAAWLIVALVALSRVYIGAHLPFDSVAGVLVGWVTGSLINLATGAWAAAAKVDQMAAGQAGNRSV